MSIENGPNDQQQNQEDFIGPPKLTDMMGSEGVPHFPYKEKFKSYEDRMAAFEEESKDLNAEKVLKRFCENWAHYFGREDRTRIPEALRERSDVLSETVMAEIILAEARDQGYDEMNEDEKLNLMQKLTSDYHRLVGLVHSSHGVDKTLLMDIAGIGGGDGRLSQRNRDFQQEASKYSNKAQVLLFFSKLMNSESASIGTVDSKTMNILINRITGARVEPYLEGYYDEDRNRRAHDFIEKYQGIINIIKASVDSETKLSNDRIKTFDSDGNLVDSNLLENTQITRLKNAYEDFFRSLIYSGFVESDGAIIDKRLAQSQSPEVEAEINALKAGYEGWGRYFESARNEILQEYENWRLNRVGFVEDVLKDKNTREGLRKLEEDLIRLQKEIENQKKVINTAHNNVGQAESDLRAAGIFSRSRKSKELRGYQEDREGEIQILKNLQSDVEQLQANREEFEKILYEVNNYGDPEYKKVLAMQDPQAYLDNLKSFSYLPSSENDNGEKVPINIGG